MRKLLKTLYVLSPDFHLAYSNENVLILKKDKLIDQFPLLSLESIVSFSNVSPTVPLMAACARQNIPLSFLSVYGTFLCRICYSERGNVLLRREQYRLADDEAVCQKYAAAVLKAKFHNSHAVLSRASRDTHSLITKARLAGACEKIRSFEKNLSEKSSVDSLRGLEGAASSEYFKHIDSLITQQKNDFPFDARTTRPPKNRLNALLSFGYTLLARECEAALETVGLDACVGFLHKDYVGRKSLSLDLMEELRAPLADRFAVTLINQNVITPAHFMPVEENGIYLNEEGKRIFIDRWEKKKLEVLTHPILNEKIPWGLIPFAQAVLLAKSIRGETTEYTGFHWR
ncbi:MAG: CRISPR-associated endonuclease Cas1 [Clostridia bacterium]|nr:CRISPR-associated endonuclease Cas1 [Clostridia bacterium]